MHFARTVALVTGVVCTASCTPVDQLELQFASQAQRSASSEIRVFLFGGPEAASPGCVALDPRGLGFGDAAQRTGLAPVYAQAGARSDPAQLGDVAAGTYTVVIEAWGPPCEAVQGDVCARLAVQSPTVLRAYYCNVFELGRQRLDGTANMESFTDIGAKMEKPMNMDVPRYPQEAPLLVTDGLSARDRFTAKVLSGIGDEQDNVKVHFSVESGRAIMEETQPVVTARDIRLSDNGLASSTLRALPGASSADEGALVVAAYAPGYEDAPLRYYCKSLPDVAIEIEQVIVPRALATMHRLDDHAVPIALYDLNSDGLQDVITVAGNADHQILVHYGGETEVHASLPQPSQARSLTVARLTPNVPSIVVSSADPGYRVVDANVQGEVRSVRQVTNPRLSIWSGLDKPASQVVLTDPVNVITQMNGVPLTKVSIAMSAADLDDDSIDEIATSGCSYLFAGGTSSGGFVRCAGNLNAKSDGEIALLAPISDRNLAVKAVILSEGNEGGFREVVFSDIDNDGDLDLVFTSNAQVHGACGNRFQGANGFEFARETSFKVLSFGGSYALAVGHFDDVSGMDVVAPGAFISGSDTARFAAFGGGNCSGFQPGPTFPAGPRTHSYLLSVRSADVNADGWDDILLLHRQDRTLQVWLGGGNLDFAAGPSIELPSGFLGELAIAREGEFIVAATASPTDNSIYRFRFTAR